MHHYHWHRTLASRGPPRLHSYLERARLIRTGRLPEPTRSVESHSLSIEMTEGDRTHLNIPATQQFYQVPRHPPALSSWRMCIGDLQLFPSSLASHVFISVRRRKPFRYCVSVLLGAQRRAEELSDRSTYLRRGIIEEGEIDVENLELLITQWVRGCTLQYKDTSGRTWKKYSSVTLASSRILESSSCRPHCEGPTISAVAAASARSARANAALRPTDSDALN